MTPPREYPLGMVTVGWRWRWYNVGRRQSRCCLPPPTPSSPRPPTPQHQLPPALLPPSPTKRFHAGATTSASHQLLALPWRESPSATNQREKRGIARSVFNVWNHSGGGGTVALRAPHTPPNSLATYKACGLGNRNTAGIVSRNTAGIVKSSVFCFFQSSVSVL